MIFCLDCGFLVSDSVPSEAAYSRMITIISESNVLEEVQETLLHQGPFLTSLRSFIRLQNEPLIVSMLR
ncbi:hypothetical protein D0463_02295 [Bacillus sp. V59.32b]|nr:hypothetical protein D0463_02295 [Bacillus sp. V59.32b]